MKDPRDQTESPYEVLGLSPNAAMDEVFQAYNAFIKDRKNITKRPAALKARDRLMRPENRVEDDLFYYPFKDISAEMQGHVDQSPFSHEPTPPNMDMDVAALSAAWPIDEFDYDPLNERTVQIGNITVFEEKFFSCLPMDFPK